MKRLKATDKAYLAATLDCEGCITINRRNAGDRPSWGQAVVIVGQKGREWLDQLRRLTGIGHVRPMHGKGCWTWNITAKQEVVDLLKAVRPFLRKKDAEAAIVLEFIASAPRVGLKGTAQKSQDETDRQWNRLRAVRRAYCRTRSY